MKPSAVFPVQKDPLLYIDRAGFGLINVLISMSVMGVMATYLSAMAVQSKRVIKSAENTSALRAQATLVRKALSDLNVCTCAVSGKVLTLPSSGGSLNDSPSLQISQPTLTSSGPNCSVPLQTLAQPNMAFADAPGWLMSEVKFSEASMTGADHVLAKIKLTFRASASAVVNGSPVLSEEIPVSILASISGSQATLSRCVSDFSLGSPLQQVAGNIIGNQITGLRPNYWYSVTLNGITGDKGNGSATLIGPAISRCNVPASLLSSVSDVNINWPDGNAPHSHTFVVQVPTDGCLQGRLDGQVNGMSYFMVGSHPEVAPSGSTTAIASSASNSQVSGLTAGGKYMVSVYGVAADHGTGGSLMGPTQVKDCSNQHVLHQNAATPMNWPDGNVPVSYSFILEVAPTSGCIQAFVDGTVPAKGITYVKLM